MGLLRSPAPPAALSATPARKRVLFLGSLQKLRLAELSQNYLIEPVLVPDLEQAERFVASGWSGVDVLYIDTGAAQDQALLEFVTRHQAALQAGGVNIVILLDRRHRHLDVSLGTVARLIDPDAAGLPEVASDLGLKGLDRPVRTGHVLVASAKGGVGKTSVALTVATYVARKLGDERRVVMVDADLFDGNLAMGLGVAETARSVLELAQAIRHGGLRPQLLDDYLTPVPAWGVRVLAAPPSSTYRSGFIDPAQMAGVYDAIMAGGVDLVVTDAPPDIRQGTPVTPVLFEPDRLRQMVILTIMGPRDYEQDGFYRMADYLRARGAADRAWLVWVQTRPYRRETDKDLLSRLAEIATTSGLRGVAGVISYSSVVEDAQHQRVPFWDVKPKGVFQWLHWRVLGGNVFDRQARALAKHVWDVVCEQERAQRSQWGRA